MAGYVRQDVTGDISNGNVVDAVDLNNEFNALVTAFGAVTGHTHDGTPANGAPITVVGPAQDYQASGSDFSPKDSATYDLGTSTFRWKDFWASGDANVGNRVFVSGNGTQTTPAFSFSSAPDAGMDYNSGESNGLSLIFGGQRRLNVRAGVIEAVGGTVFTGDGGGLTNLNASILASGVVPNARISGSYTGFANITASGVVTGDSFVGTGTSLTALNASNLASGTVAGPRLSGSYTGITGVGTLNAGSINTGFGNINIGTSTFTGNGSGLSSLNASNLSSGTVPSNRLSGTYSFGSLTLSDGLTASSGGFTVNSSGGHVSSGNITSTTGNFGGNNGLNLRPQGGGTSTNQTTISSTGNMTVNGSVTGSSFIGNINASSLNTGTVPNARISGSYSNFANITASGNVRAARMGGDGNGSQTAPVFFFYNSSNSGLYLSSNHVYTTVNGSWKMGVTDNTIIARGGVVFTGDGGGLSNLNASALSSGTVPNARISGSYTGFSNIVASGYARSGRVIAVDYGSQATPAYTFHNQGSSGMDYNSSIGVSLVVGGTRRLNVSSTAITANGTVFTGNGSGLTSLNASNITSGTMSSTRLANLNANKITAGTFSLARIPNMNAEKLTSGTLPVARLGTSTSERNWVLARTSSAGAGAIGSYAFLATDSSSISTGATVSGSNLRYGGSRSNGVMSGGSRPSGTWRCMGHVGTDNDAHATLFLRIS